MRVNAGQGGVNSLHCLCQEADQIGHDEQRHCSIQPRRIGVIEKDQAEPEHGSRDGVAQLNDARYSAARRLDTASCLCHDQPYQHSRQCRCRRKAQTIF